MSETPKKKQKKKKEPESPAEASKEQIAKIEAELAKILKDSANDDMSYAGRQSGDLYKSVVCMAGWGMGGQTHR